MPASTLEDEQYDGLDVENEWGRLTMADLISLLAVAILFAVALVYVTGCDGLKGASR